MKTILAFSLIVLFDAKGMAQKSDAIAGVSCNDKKMSKIEIKEQNGQFIGTAIYISPTSYVDGQPEKDFNNPDANLRSRSRLGLQILSGLKYVTKDNQWQNGRIYDPDNGKTYDCYAWFDNDPNTLYLKGYVVGIKWLGLSTTWTRATD
jgi:uncharacterized protein (DUF2147 family)